MITKRSNTMGLGNPVWSLMAWGVISANVAMANQVETANLISENTAAQVQPPLLEQVTVVGKNLEGRTTSVGKMDAAITDIPFSVSIITQDFFTATGVKTLQDAFQYSAGVNGGPYGVDSRGDWATIRGVSPTIYLDGMRKSLGSYNNTRQAPFTLERVEILKGPASVGYGQASTGGIINMVSKRPQEEFSGEVWAQAGNFDRKQLAVDVTGPIDADGKWLYRLVALKRNSKSQVDHVDDDSLVIMPSLTWRPTDQTSITVMVNEQENETGTSTQFLPWYGTVLPNPNGGLDLDVFLGEPDFDKYDSEQTAYSLSFEHEFNEIFALSGNYRKSKSEVDYRTMWPAFTAYTVPAVSPYYRLAADGRTAARTAYVSDHTANTTTYDLRLNADFDTGAIEHSMVFAYDVQDITTDNDFAYGFGGYIDVFNPVYGQLSAGDQAALNALSPDDKPSTALEQKGIYFLDQIKYENWILSAGIRRDDVENSTQYDPVKDKDKETTKQFGLMYQFESGVSPYFSYTESFEPVAGSNLLGARYKPAEGEQKEWGVKYQPPGSSLLVTAAFYEIEEANRLMDDPSVPNNKIQSAGGEIRGYELEVQGTWDQIDLIASYTKLDAKLQENGQDTVNISAVPDEQASAWVSYRFADKLAGLRIGLGARYTGTTYDGSDNEALETDSYTLVDGMIGYELENWFLSLNARNLTDKEHLTSCLGRGDCFAGEARTVTADVRYKF